MPDKVNLSPKEQILCFFAIIVVSASIALALCVGLILPRHWTKEGYISNTSGRSIEELSEKCHCWHRILTTNYINCIPRAFSQRVLTFTTKKSALCDMVQNYPYLVSLHAPAYNDDKKERRFACSGTILTKTWVLVGEECVQEEEELKWLRIRAGSTYWSKGGTQHVPKALSRLKNGGPSALKVNPPFTFSRFTTAVKLPKKGVYTAWITAANAGWHKNSKRRYDKFSVQRWTTTPCADGCQTGKVRVKPPCGNKIIGTSLVAERRLLIGILGAICHEGNRSEYSYIDVQTEEYESWFDFLADRSGKAKRIFQPLERAVDNTTAKPLKIYELKECAVLDPNLLEDTATEDENSAVSSAKTIQDTKPTQTGTETIIVDTTNNVQTTLSEDPTFEASPVFSSEKSESTVDTVQEPTDVNPPIFPPHGDETTTSSRATELVFTEDNNSPLFDRKRYPKIPSFPTKKTKDEKIGYRINPEFKPEELENERGGNPAVLGTDVEDEYGNDKDGEALEEKFVIPLQTIVENVEHLNTKSPFSNKKENYKTSSQAKDENVGLSADPVIKLDEYENANKGNVEPEADVTDEYRDKEYGEILEQKLPIPLPTMDNVENNSDDETTQIPNQVLIESATTDISNSIN